MTNYMPNHDFAAKYPTTAEQYKKALERLAQGEAEESLTAARKALESVVKEICKKCGIDTTDTNRSITLFDMIEHLAENSFLREDESSLLHKVRMLCNKGAHVGESETPSAETAEEAITLLAKVLELLASKDDTAAFGSIASANNIPMLNSDYYDPRRKFRGEWSECYTHEDLAVLPDYMALKRKADNGDISAMLDLAIGFMPKKPFWSPEHILCMPKFRARGKEFCQERAYDTRYYYWITRACDQAVANVYNEEGEKTYPKKYMANAFLEAMKFGVAILSRRQYLYVSNVKFGRNPEEDEPEYTDQYQLTETLYGKQMNDIYAVNRWSLFWGYQLLKLIEEAGTCDIIVGIHRENSVEAIKYLIYCVFCRSYFTLNENYELATDNTMTVQEEFALHSDDIGKPVIPELLMARQPADMPPFYCAVVQQCVQELMEAATNVSKTDHDYTDEQYQSMSFPELYRAYEKGSPRATFWLARRKELDNQLFDAYRIYCEFEKKLEENETKHFERLKNLNDMLISLLERIEIENRIDPAAYRERLEKKVLKFGDENSAERLMNLYDILKIKPYPAYFMDYIKRLEQGGARQKIIAAEAFERLNYRDKATVCCQEIYLDPTASTIHRGGALVGLARMKSTLSDGTEVTDAVLKQWAEGGNGAAALAYAWKLEHAHSYIEAESMYKKAMILVPEVRENLQQRISSQEFLEGLKAARKNRAKDRIGNGFALIFVIGFLALLGYFGSGFLKGLFTVLKALF